jgi:hypothetical protein
MVLQLCFVIFYILPFIGLFYLYVLVRGGFAKKNLICFVNFFKFIILYWILWGLCFVIFYILPSIGLFYLHVLIRGGFAYFFYFFISFFNFIILYWILWGLCFVIFFDLLSIGLLQSRDLSLRFGMLT